jgi:hypothetical protein
VIQLGESRFARYIGIDYSGALSPGTRLAGLRAYVAGRREEPLEVRVRDDRRIHWTRRELAEWLAGALASGPPTLVGIDHGFSFPLAYFRKHALPLDWDAFLEDFRRHWPTDEDWNSVDFIREGMTGAGAQRTGDSRWRRLAELRTKRAKSVFHFDVPGSVAKSTHAGLPWLLRLRRTLGASAHFWPFDGWRAPFGAHVIAEAYPSLWNSSFERGSRTADQHDAWCVAEWLRRADQAGYLAGALEPQLSANEREIARVEGWIVGVA